jgi:hypothetical protein
LSQENQKTVGLTMSTKPRSSSFNRQNQTVLTGGAMVLAITAPVLAQGKPFLLAGTSQPSPLPPPAHVISWH